ncbi:esterase FE4-like [Eupeodes corollae]|uniref:esterase FE4-like n=1 Tax=Eupeodes corollae TaxID=290404 RepID=UPI00249165BF|nr:esterase FE4-like [Eupeodes corollae]
MTNLLKIFVLLLFLELLSAQISTLVETHLGKIRGSLMKTEKGSDFIGFRGIKYAEPPIGENRFKPPIAIKPWSGELNATTDGFMCPQVGKPMHLLSEDCLVINVYTKHSNKNQSVVVFIHGGANIYGNSHSEHGAGPEFLMENDIVFVTMNYRLGPFGFLTTRTKEAPGNYGYLDQVMALEWVHDHISKFGGNPRSVTIFGISSGSIYVSLHLVSPRSQGLFHKAIIMSGSATADYEFDNLHWGRKLARELACPIYNPPDVLDCLRKLPWTTIVSVASSWDFFNMTDMKWSYQIDGHFLTKPPTVTFAEGNFSKIPILTGLTKDEYTFMFNIHENNSGLLNDITLNFAKYAPKFFVHNFDDPKIDKTKIVQSFYLGNQSLAKQKLSNFGKIFSDSMANYSINRLVQLARKFVDVYYYRFDYLGRFGVFENWEGKPLGVNHADDLQYIIKRRMLRKTINPNDPEWFMVTRMVKVITTFAETGSPELDGVKWLPSNKTAVNTMYIGRKVKLGFEPLKERLQLWDKLFPVEISSAPAEQGPII